MDRGNGGHSRDGVTIGDRNDASGASRSVPGVSSRLRGKRRGSEGRL